MERYLSSSRSSPLRAMQALEKNLKREQRMFSLFLGILVCVLVGSAFVMLASKVSHTLRLYEQSVRLADESASAVVVRRLAMLDTARYLLTARTPSGELQRDVETSSLCRGESLTLQQSEYPLFSACQDATALLVANGGDAPLLIADLTTDALVEHNFPTARTDQLIMTSAGLTYMREQYLNHVSEGPRSLAGAKYGAARRVVWAVPPAEWNLGQHTLLGMAAVRNSTGMQLLLATSIELSDLRPTFAHDTNQGNIALIDAGGHVLAGTLPIPDAAVLFQSTSPMADGEFKLITPFEWGMRWSSRSFEGATIVAVVPWTELASVLRTELLLGSCLTLLAVSALLAGGKFWRYQFIGRTYREAKLALEREMLHHLLVHASPIGLGVVRREGFRVMVANDHFRRVLQLEANASELPTAFVAAFATQTLERAAPDGDDPDIRKFSFSFTVDDKEANLEVTFAPATLNGDAVYFCAIADMTTHVQAENALRQAKAASDQVAKAKLQFFASMSHEIRTPLTSLTGNLELVSRGPLSAEQRARVVAMQSSTNDLLQVVNDVLDFSKIDVGHLQLTPEWTPLLELLSNVAIAHLPVANRQKLDFYLVASEHLPGRIRIDALRLTQVLNNIISNAFKFTKSGKVVLRADWIDAQLVLTLTDSGIGIPEDLLPRLFQPFVQGDQHRLTQIRGTGLGLSICSRLVTMMGGTIALHSTLGVGTRVDIRLPFDSADQEPATGSRLPAPTRIAVLAQASEYTEWFNGVFAGEATVLHVASPAETGLSARYDCLVATDEFDLSAIEVVWGGTSGIVLAGQAGPLHPEPTPAGALRVCAYSLAGLVAAVADPRPATATRASADSAATSSHASAGTPSPAASTLPDTSTDASGQPEGTPLVMTGLTVLVAEDNALNLALLQDQLRTLGVDTIPAHDGLQALEQFKKHRVDAVLTDVNMPGLGGYELLSALRERDPDLPVYAISASVQPDDIRSGRDHGFTDYLTKPLPLAALEAVVQDLLAMVRAPEGSPDLPDVPDIYRDILATQIERDLSALPDVRASQDVARLERWIHRVCGGLMQLGPSGLADLCSELLDMSRAGGAWTEDIDALTTEVAQGLQALLSQTRRAPPA
ncbi:hypothetical protein CEK29_16195 [Bordetella genomosp. 5]|nr:hypothetical protein CEK29_16195 [Bordetella genomosp. 5]